MPESHTYNRKPFDHHQSSFLLGGGRTRKLKEDIAKVLVVFPESWSRSKREYVKLVSKDSANNVIWMGRKSDFALSGNKARINYDAEDIRKLESVPDLSTLQIRSDRGYSISRSKMGNGLKLKEKAKTLVGNESIRTWDCVQTSLRLAPVGCPGVS